MYPRTDVQELFKIETPILQAGMAWVSGAKLVAAASNAGALGILSAGSMSLDILESQIEKADSKQDVSMDSKSYREQNWFKEPEPVPQPEHKEDLVEPLMEKIKDIVAQMPEEERHTFLLE